MSESLDDSKKNRFITLPRTSSSKSLYSNLDRSKLLLLPITRQKSLTNLNQTQLGSDLEWDKDIDFVCKAESDTLSIYDLNEQIQELLKQKILEFEVMSLSDSKVQNSTFDDDDTDSDIQVRPIIRIKRNSSIYSNGMEISPIEFSNNPSSLVTPADCLTVDDLLKMKFLNLEQSYICTPLEESNKPFLTNGLYAPITFDLESSQLSVNKNENLTLKVNMYHSMPDLRLLNFSKWTQTTSFKDIKLHSKHTSLMDIRSFNFVYLKNAGVRKDEKECDAEKKGPRLIYNFSRMSRLARLKCYMSRLGEKVKQVLRETFTNQLNKTKASESSSMGLYSINEELFESYDIIESDSSILKQ